MLHIIHPTMNRMLVLLLILSLLMTGGCSPFRAASPQPGDTPSPAEEIPAVSDEELEPLNVDELEVQFKEEDFQPVSYPIEPLGSIAFTKDDGAAVERELSPEDEAVELQVVDGAGLTWTLRIPAGALMSLETVRLVPLSQLKGSLKETAGEVVGGISLEPDGLTFREPVQLSVSGGTLQGLTIILTGTGSGADIGYTLQETAADDPTSNMLHFSTYFASSVPDPGIVKLYKAARKEYDALAAEAKKLRRAPLEIPTPPSIALECTDGETKQENNEEIEEFIKEAQNPELELVEKMLIQWRIIALTSAHEVEGVPDLAVGMIMRNVRKATAMIDKYHGDEEKLLAVSGFALRSARQLALLGGDQEMMQEIIEKVGLWNRSLIDDLVEDIDKNHNYKRIPMAMMVAYNAALLGKGVNTDDFLNKLREALLFEARFKFTIQDDEIEFTQTTEAVVKMQIEPTSGWLYRCFGEGAGASLNAEMKTDHGSITIKTNEYPVEVSLTEFDPCNGTVKMGIDRFGSEKDTIIFTPPEGAATEGPWTLTYDAGESVFSDRRPDGSIYYIFEVPVNNGKEMAVDETIEPPSHDNFQDTLEIQLIHK